MKVLITGSRDWSNIWPILADMKELAGECAQKGERLTIIHGNSKRAGVPIGADSLATKVAGMLGANLYRFPAEWDALGKPAGMIRNFEMLETMQPDIVYAYPLPQSKGTFGCINAALALGIPVVVR